MTSIGLGCLADCCEVGLSGITEAMMWDSVKLLSMIKLESDRPMYADYIVQQRGLRDAYATEAFIFKFTDPKLLDLAILA